jgi:phage-related protein
MAAAGRVEVDVNLDTSGLNEGISRMQSGISRMTSGIRAGIQRASTHVANFGNRFRSMGEGMADAGEQLSQSLALPFLAVGAAAIVGAQKTKEGAKAWKEFQKNINNLLLALAPLGTAILNFANTYLPPLINKVKQVMKWFQGLSPTTQKVIIALGLLAIALGPVIMFIGALVMTIGGAIQAFGAISAALAGVSSTVFIVIGVIIALVAIFVVLWNKCAWFRSFWISVWNQVKAAVIAVWNFIKPYIMAAITAVSTFIQQKLAQIRTWWAQNGAQIMAAIQRVWNWIKPYIQAGMNFIKTVMKAGFQVVVTIVKMAWEAIKTVIDVAIDLILGIIKAGAQLINGNWRGALNTLRSTTLSIWNRIKSGIANIVKSLISAARSWGVNLMNMFANGVRAAGRRVIAAARAIANKVKSYLGFSSPTKEGPASKSDKWAPNFVNMFADGLKAGIPNVERAAGRIASMMSGNFTASGAGAPARGSTSNITINNHGGQLSPSAIVSALRRREWLGGV